MTTRFLSIALTGLAVLLPHCLTQADEPVPRHASEAAMKMVREVLDVAGVTQPGTASVETVMTEEEAKDLLWQVHTLIHDKNEYSTALPILKRIMAYDPLYAASYWPERKVVAGTVSELCDAYRGLEDWEKALPALELLERLHDEWYPMGDSINAVLIAECRQRLAQMGKLQRGPMAIIGNRTIATDRVVGGTLLAPLSEIAPLMGITVTRDPYEIKLVGPNGSTMVLKLGELKARIGEREITLPVAPRQEGNLVFVPLRAVAEAFGVSVTWDAVPKIAWVR